MKNYWLAFAVEHLELLVREGMPFHDALHMVAMDVSHRPTVDLLRSAAQEAEAGTPIHQIEPLRKLMPDGMVGLLKLTEDSQQLADKLHLMARMLTNKSKDPGDEIKTFLGPFQTAVIIVLALTTYATVVRININIFGQIFGSLGAQLPSPTRLVLAMNEYMAPIWFPAIMIFTVVSIYLWYLSKYPNKSMISAKLMWYLPVFSYFKRQDFLVVLIEYLMTGIRLNLNWNEVFNCMADNMVNPLWAVKARHVATVVAAGESLENAFESAGIQAIDTVLATSTRNISDSEEMLSNYQDAILTDMKLRYHLLTTRFSATTITCLVFTMGYIVIAMYLPMFSLVGELS